MTNAPPTRPLLNSQIETLRVLLYQTADGRPAQMSPTPTALLKRGLVCVAIKAERPLKPGRTGWKGNPACYALTPTGREIAEEAQRRRTEFAELRRANRGHNAAL